MFRILNLEFRNYLGFRILYLGFFLLIFMFPQKADAGIIGRTPTGLGYNPKNRIAAVLAILFSTESESVLLVSV